jgi:type II secretory pathway pseudopilin PulG
MRLKNKISNNGFTILEAAIALTIMGIIFTVIVAQFTPLRRSWDTNRAENEIIQNARVLYDHIDRNLSKAVQITAVSSPSSNNGYIEFQDAESNIMRYELEDDYVNFGQSGSTAQLAGEVSALNFKCYSLEDMDSPVTDPNSIRFVTTNTTFANSSENGQEKQFTNSVFIRTNNQTTTTAASRLAVSDSIYMTNSEIDGYRSGNGSYSPRNRNSSAVISTNSTGSRKITMYNRSSVNGDVYVGPGGDTDRVIYKSIGSEITGSTSALSSEVPIPAISLPTGRPFNRNPENGIKLTGNRTEVVNKDRYLRYLYLYDRSRLKINKDVTIVVEGNIIIYDRARIELHKKGSLNLYCKGVIYCLGDINSNTADPTKVNVYMTAVNQYFLIYMGGEVHAAVQAPYSYLYVYYGSDFYGSFVGRHFYSYNGATHLDLDLPSVGGVGGTEISP